MRPPFDWLAQMREDLPDRTLLASVPILFGTAVAAPRGISFRAVQSVLRTFALEGLSVICDADSRITRVRYVLPRHKAANWVGQSRKRKST